MLVLTRGADGSILFYKNKFYYCPAFASNVVDKVGAGDAMMALMSLLVNQKFDLKLSLFLGALAAANNVEKLNNLERINKTNFLKNATHMMK